MNTPNPESAASPDSSWRLNASLIRAWGVIAISVLVCVIFIGGLVVVVVTKDLPSQQLLLGILGGAFTMVVGYFVGSSAGSAEKSEKLEVKPPSAPSAPA